MLHRISDHDTTLLSSFVYFGQFTLMYLMIERLIICQILVDEKYQALSFKVEAKVATINELQSYLLALMLLKSILNMYYRKKIKVHKNCLQFYKARNRKSCFATHTND